VLAKFDDIPVCVSCLSLSSGIVDGAFPIALRSCVKCWRHSQVTVIPLINALSSSSSFPRLVVVLPVNINTSNYYQFAIDISSAALLPSIIMPLGALSKS
jgi:hypothetical protein